MKKLLLIALLALSGLAMAQYDAKPGTTPDTTPPIANYAMVGNMENFDDITTLAGDGWTEANNSTTTGTTTWFQGSTTVFNAYEGADDSYIGANYNSTTGSSTICTWLILPDLGYLQNISFYTRTATGSTWADRLVVRYSSGGGVTTGDCDNGFGDFGDSLLEINSALTTGGYPETWTQFTAPVNGAGRVALVYYVTDGGPSGTNSNYIGIDSLAWEAGTPPAPAVVPTLGWVGLTFMLLLLGFFATRKLTA